MSTKTRRWTGLLTTLLTVAAVLPSHAAPEQVQAHPQPTWITTWMASPEARWNGDFPLPTDLPYHLWDQTVRQVARVSVGGSRVRILLSNAYGTRPLKINAVDIAFAGRDASIVPGSNHVVTFGGKTSVVIPPGAPMLSDPIDLKIAALSHLAVSLYLPDPTAPATFHWDARQTAYVGAGNQAAATSLTVDSPLTTRVFLAGIEVEAAPGTRTVVAIGDSITDGHGATMDADARWPDFLARRLASRKVAVLNAGISGARMLRDKMGANALARFQRDVLAQPGIKAVIVLMGINDIAWKGTPLALADESTTAEDLIESYKQLIARAHARGVRVIGATLTPFEGALDDTPMHAYYSADKERTRQRVNHWIRHSGAFDAVIDFDAVLRDPTHPTRLLPAYDCGDHLHPGDAGNRAMAEAINLRALLGK